MNMANKMVVKIVLTLTCIVIHCNICTAKCTELLGNFDEPFKLLLPLSDMLKGCQIGREYY